MLFAICMIGVSAITIAVCFFVSRQRMIAAQSEDRKIDRLLRALRANSSSPIAGDDSDSKSDESRGDVSINPGGPRLSHDVPTLPLRNRWDLPLSHHEQPAAEPFPLPGSDTPLFAESR